MSEPDFLGRLCRAGVRTVTVASVPHVQMHGPIRRIAPQAATKAGLGQLLARSHPEAVRRDRAVDGRASPGVGGLVFRPGERQQPCRDGCFTRRAAGRARRPGTPRTPPASLAGLKRAAESYAVAALGGHTQSSVPCRTAGHRPVPGGGARPGHAVRLTTDLGGGRRVGLGQVGDHELPSLVAAAHAFPSPKEGFGLAADAPLVVRELPVPREAFGPATHFAATPDDLAYALGAAVSDDDPVHHAARRAGRRPPATPDPRPRGAT